ncbi:MAG: alpha/beta hydrolase, partial [Caldimonas sp.]
MLALTSAVLLAACGGNNDSQPTPAPAPVPEETRPQDARVFTAPVATTFAAMAPATGDVVDVATTSRWAGVLGGAAYRVEVPANWNGKLVMYAHGYAGTGAPLVVSNPLIRRYLIQNGYAWAASSYSKNYYDVRAGIEDTNALALEFNNIAAANMRPLTVPTKRYITGVSMGGQITAAAIEAETAATAVHKVSYAGAVPMCGVLGDTELFNEFAAMQVTAQALAGVPNYPTDKFAEINTLVTNTLFTTFPSVPTATGVKYLSVVKNITGG